VVSSVAGATSGLPRPCRTRTRDSVSSMFPRYAIGRTLEEDTMEPTKANRRGRRLKDRTKHVDEARARWLEKPRWSAHAIARMVAGQHRAVRGLQTFLRKVLAVEDRQACFEEARQVRRENPTWSEAEIIQTVKARNHPRRQKLRGIEAELAAELARDRPPETRGGAEAGRQGQSVVVASPPAGSWRLDWRTLGPMVAEGERVAAVAAQMKADMAKARAWMLSKEQLAMLRSQLAMRGRRPCSTKRPGACSHSPTFDRPGWMRARRDVLGWPCRSRRPGAGGGPGGAVNRGNPPLTQKDIF